VRIQPETGICVIQRCQNVQTEKLRIQQPRQSGPVSWTQSSVVPKLVLAASQFRQDVNRVEPLEHERPLLDRYLQLGRFQFDFALDRHAQAGLEVATAPLEFLVKDRHQVLCFLLEVLVRTVFGQLRGEAAETGLDELTEVALRLGDGVLDDGLVSGEFVPLHLCLEGGEGLLGADLEIVVGG
jgi:hypothetical protein